MDSSYGSPAACLTIAPASTVKYTNERVAPHFATILANLSVALVGVKGTLQAAFDGQHGWFWRSRGPADESVTLKTQGQYSAIKRKL